MPHDKDTLRALTWIERALYAAAILLLGGWAAVTVEAQLYGYVQERRLAQMIDAQQATAAPATPARTAERRFVPAQPPPSLTPAIPPPEIVGRIEIPRLHIRAVIAEGIDGRTLRRAVGHVPGTPLPGQDGNVVLAGHRDTFFRALKDIRADDIVRITTLRGRFEYVVEATAVVEPTRTDVLDATSQPSVTLVTCYPFYLVGDAPDRFVVRARLLGTGD